MSDASEPAGPRGLARSLTDLFAGRAPVPLRIPTPLARVGTEDAVERLTRAWLHAEPDERPPLAARLVREAQVASAHPERVERLADAVERIVSHHVLEADEVAMVRTLTTRPVAEVLTSRLRASIRDEARREELVAAALHLGPTFAQAVKEALEVAEDRSVRRALLDALVRAAPSSPRVLADMVQDHRWFVVRNAATVLGELEDPDAVEHLTGVLAHSHPRVRREAVMSLARVGGDDGAQLILGMLDDPDDGVRAASAMALGVLGVERSVRTLLERLDEEEHTDVQVELLRALGQLGDPAAVSAIEKRARPSRFSRTPVAVRIAAFRALAAIGTPHARAVVQEGLEDRESEVRNAVRASLRERG